RLQPAAVFPAVPASGEEGHPDLDRQWRLADRLVAAGPGRAVWQVSAGRAAALGLPRRQRLHELADPVLALGGGSGRRPEAQAPRREGRMLAVAVRARLGA